MRTNKFSNVPIALALGVVAGVYISTSYLSRKLAQDDTLVVSWFHRMYHNKWWEKTMVQTHWMGSRIMKTPLDLWVYQEIIYETEPDVLIETGTLSAGSANYYASLFELLGNGRVYTVDIEDFPKRLHARVEFRHDSSTSDATIDWLQGELGPNEVVMVTLDSLHTKEHVLEELDLYAPFVSLGSYLVVEDTHLTGHPIHGPLSPDSEDEGPWEAVAEWLPNHPEFEADKSRERFGLTYNPNGWLKRVR
jgi:cephalosporin hydroxylase